jgi:CrcB protein
MFVPVSRSNSDVSGTRPRATHMAAADPGPAPEAAVPGGAGAAREAQQLPVDSDTDVVDRCRRPLRPLGVHPRDLLWVIIGGAIGVAARDVATQAAMASLTEPGITIVINVTGCLLLGLLLETLTSRGADHGRRRRTRLLAGTGALGGFTSYSTFAVGVCQMLASGRLIGGLGYGLGSVLAGVLAAAGGVWVGAVLHRRFTGRR